MKTPKRMSIDELEQLLQRDEQPEIEIKPDGTIVTKKGRRRSKPLTFRNELGGEYGVAA